MPLTLHHVCIFLRLQRSVGRRCMTTAMETVDALLLYAQVRVEADAAAAARPALQGASGSSSSGGTQHHAASSSNLSAVKREKEGDNDDDELAAVAAAATVPLPPPLPLLSDLHPREVEEMLRTCIDLSSKPKLYHTLVRHLADYLAQLLVQEKAEEDAEMAGAAAGDALESASNMKMPTFSHRRLHPSAHVSPAASSKISNSWSASPATAADSRSALARSGWDADLMLLVDLCSLLVRLGEAEHRAVPMLFDVLYTRRGTLLQRALLVKMMKESLEQAGRPAHPALYKLIVDGEVL